MAELVWAMACYFRSTIYACHLWLKYNEIFFSYTQPASISDMIIGFPLGYQSPLKAVLNFFVLQIPYILGNSCGVVGISCPKAGHMIPPSIFK